jgi:gas vesicle protein
MESGKVVLGVLAGVAVGAVLGILLAPEKGSITRGQILSKGEGYAHDLSDKLDHILETVSKTYDGALHQAGELTAKGRVKFDQIKKEIGSATA